MPTTVDPPALPPPTSVIGPDAAGRSPVDVSDPLVIPLNAMDELCLHLDTPRFPWTIQVELRAPGRIDESRLGAAVADAASRHPMARARLAPFKPTDRVYHWQIADELAVDPVWILRAATEAEMAERRSFVLSATVPLDDAPPFRVWLVHRPGGDTLLLSANHVATDGMGAMRLLRSIVRSYAGHADAVLPVDPRTDLDVSELAGPTSVVDRLGRLAGYGAGLRRAAGRVSRISLDGGEPGAPGFGFHQVVVPAIELAMIDPKRHAEATLNDVLLAALHLAIDDWNADHFAETQRISVMMPVNVRSKQSWHETMTNFSMMVAVQSTDDDRADAATLMGAVVEQTSRAKRTGSATVLLELLDHSDWLPSLAKQMIPRLSPLAGDSLVDTAVLSNLGRVVEPFDFGSGPAGGAATELWFSPPARMPLGVGLGAVTFNGDLHLSFRWCRAQFDAAAAAAFAHYYRRALTFVS